MKYLKIFLILSTLEVSFILSSGQDTDEVRNVYSKTHLTIKENEKRSESSSNESPLLADLVFSDDTTDKIIEAKVGDSLKLDMKVNTDKKYKDGKVTLCELYESSNPTNKKKICDECGEYENIVDEWRWDEENQKFVTNFEVMKLPNSNSQEITIECSAKVCRRECPEVNCQGNGSKRKRRRVTLRLPLKKKMPNGFNFRLFGTVG